VILGQEHHRFASQNLEYREKVIILLILAILFAPFIPGTRLRPDVVLSYLCVPFALIFIGRQPDWLLRIYGISLFCVLWTLTRILTSEESSSLFLSVQLLTGLNIIFLSVCVVITFSVVLRNGFRSLFHAVLIASLPINLVAISQWLATDSQLSQFIFEYYGGTIAESQVDLSVLVLGELVTQSEYLAKVAGRYSSIFAGMYALGAFNIIVIILALGALIGGSKGGVRLLYILSIILGSAGGFLSASKTFYFGTFLGLIIFSQLSRSAIRGVVIIAILGAASVSYIYNLADEDSAIRAYFLGSADLSYSNVLESRYGADGLRETIIKVLTDPLVLLAGRGSDIDGYYMADSGYLPPLIVGGLPLLIATAISIYAIISRTLWCSRAGCPMAAALLAVQLVFVTLTLALPSYQIPRVSISLIILNLTYLLSYDNLDWRRSGFYASPYALLAAARR
jgi:hypothetical protein